MVQKSLIWVVTVSQTKLKRMKMARAFPPLKLTDLMHLKNSLFFLPLPHLWRPVICFICLKQRTLERCSLKFIFSTLGHTITAVHSCFACLDIGRIHVFSVIVTAFPGQAACSRFRPCPPLAVESASQTLFRCLQKQMVSLLSWYLTSVMPLRFWSVLSEMGKPSRKLDKDPECCLWHCS